MTAEWKSGRLDYEANDQEGSPVFGLDWDALWRAQGISEERLVERANGGLKKYVFLTNEANKLFKTKEEPKNEPKARRDKPAWSRG